MEHCKECNHKNIEQEIVSKYKGKPDKLIACLQEVQEVLGFIPQRVTVLISNTLGIPESDIYSVITFYKQFSLKPKAKYTVEVCMGTACYVLGAEKLVAEIKKELKLEKENYTEDGKFELVQSRCLGCCGIAPVISVNGKIFGTAKPSQVKSILSECK